MINTDNRDCLCGAKPGFSHALECEIGFLQAANAYAGSVPLGLPVDSQWRKDTPLHSGVLRYFPLALLEVARLSKAGNDKHNPGQPLHWSRGKSNDHADCAARHLLEAGTIDPDDGHRHSTKLAWRALAMLQLELEADGISVDRVV